MAETKKTDTKPKAEKVAAKVYKARLRINSQDSATIFRGNGLPYIDDKVDAAVTWLAANGFKADEIEIIGEKPAIWNTVYPTEVPVAEVPVAVEATQV